jgi:hypothetical protein
MSAFYIDLHIEIDNGGRIKGKQRRTQILHFSFSHLPLQQKQFSSITLGNSLNFTT